MASKAFYFSLILLACFSTAALSASTACTLYLGNLAFQSKQQIKKALAPYLLVSGKSIDDLGFPETCQKMKNATYNTAEVLSPVNNYKVRIYYGLCFNDACSASDLNSFNQTIVELINNFTQIKLQAGTQLTFVTPELHAQSSIGSIIFLVLFSLLVVLATAYTVVTACQQSMGKSDDKDRRRYTFEDTETSSTDNTKLLERLSFQYKYDHYLGGETEKSNKIVSFSIFKILSLPLMILGQEFYYRNFAAYNYFAFYSEVYASFYSKISMFAVYLPDVLFFISAYLLGIKALSYDSFGLKQAGSLMFRKFLRLYPMYIAVLCIYWFISPTLHAGPVWYVYTDQTDVCNSYWWSSVLLINNWFESKCFAGGWFVEAELQLALLGVSFFLLRDKFRKTSSITLVVLLIASLSVTFGLSPGMPASVESTLNPKLQRFLTATYSHLFFYLFGIGIAILRNNQTLSENIEDFFEKKRSLDASISIVSFGICVLIMMRPSIWATASGIEFTFCRLGVMLAFFGFFAGGIWQNTDAENATHVHKIAHYTYPMMLISIVICLSSVWSSSSFSYLSGLGLLNLMVAELLLSVGTGLLLGLIVEPRLRKER